MQLVLLKTDRAWGALSTLTTKCFDELLCRDISAYIDIADTFEI